MAKGRKEIMDAWGTADDFISQFLNDFRAHKQDSNIKLFNVNQNKLEINPTPAIIETIHELGLNDVSVY